MAKIVLRDRFYIPRKLVSMEELKDGYERAIYQEQDCNVCPNKRYRHNSRCDNCNSYLGELALWSKVDGKSGKGYIAIPSGSKEQILDKLKIDVDKHKIVDKRPIIPFSSKLKFTRDLWDGSVDSDGNPRANQVQIVDDWLNAAKANNIGGQIKSPPRSGKTVIAVKIVCELKVRSIIIASQVDFLRQFAMRFGELTNLKDLVGGRSHHSPVVLVDSDPKGWTEAEGKKYGVKVVREWTKDLNKADVVLSTYQAFIVKPAGPRRAKKFVNDKFSLLVVDEVDQAAATAFSRFVNRINVWRKCGVSATEFRKDGLEEVVRDTIGKVVSKGDITTLRPRIRLWETGLKLYDYKQWHRLEKSMMDNKTRNEMIVRQVFADLRASPDTSILIPVNRTDHVKNLVQMINHQCTVNRAKGEQWPRALAVEFKRGVNRDHVLTMVKQGQRRVVVAITKMVKRGLDVPEWTDVYIGVVPTSNAPNFYQLASRVATPKKGKTRSRVKIIVDDMKASIYCLRSLALNKHDGLLRGITNDPPTYKMGRNQLIRLKEIIKYPRSYSYADAPEENRLGRTKSEKANKQRSKKKLRRF